ARVVYDAEVDGSGGPSELWYVDCSGPVPGPVIRINHPLDPGWEVASRRISPSYRWLMYTAWHPQLDEQEWIVDMAKPTPGVPVQVEYPAEAQGLGGLAAYSHDDTMIAFYAGQGKQIHLCTLEPDGGCAPELWDVPFVDGGANNNNEFAFSPDDTRIAWVGDPDADGTQHAFLSGTAPGDAGTAI